MKAEQKSRSLLGAVIVAMIVLAILSYVLPGTLAAYLFPGISRMSAVETGKPAEITLSSGSGKALVRALRRS